MSSHPVQQLHIKMQSFDGYCVGTGIEYPGIIISAATKAELAKKFKNALPGHIKALKKYGQADVAKNTKVIAAGQ